MDKKEQFLSKFPKSRYARYIEYSLGITYITQQDEVLFRRGLELLEKAAGYKGFFLAEEAYEWLIRQRRKRGEQDKAKEYQAQMAARFPNSPEGRDYLEQNYIRQRDKDEPEDMSKTLEPSSTRGLPLLAVGAALGLCVVVIAGLVVLGKKRGK